MVRELPQARRAVPRGHHLWQGAERRTLSAGEIAEYESALAGLEPVGGEFEALAARTDLAPDVNFDRELAIDLGGREVRLLHLGRGNTAGDVVAWLPSEKILVAGDLLDHPVPYLGGGYPVEEIATLEAVARLGADTIVPGHGMVLDGESEGVPRAGDGVPARGCGCGRRRDPPRRSGRGQAGRGQGRGPGALPGRRVAGQVRGDDQEARDFFEGFALDGAITAAYAALWGR